VKCERLRVLIRDWYHEVRNFTLSPIKMKELVEKHIKNCEVCQTDEDLPLELDQLWEIIRVPYLPNKSEEFKFKIEENEYLYEDENLEEEEF